MHSAAIYLLKDRVLVHPWERTAVGLGIASEPFVSLPVDANPDTLGKAILTALSHSGQTVPHPRSWKGLDTPRLKAAGVKSERAFQSGTRSLSVERGAESFRIEPSRNGGTKGDTKGFEPLPERSILVASDASAEKLGAAVRTGFERCA